MFAHLIGTLRTHSGASAANSASLILPRTGLTAAVQQYAVVVLGVAATTGLSLILRKYTYPRPLFVIALLVSAWGRGLGPTLLGAALAAAASEFFFPEWLPSHGIVSDVIVFGLAAVICSTFSGAKLRAEVKLKTLCTELVARQGALSRAEENCRESELRFRTLADYAPVMIWMSGPDAKYTHFNKPWLDFRSRSLEQELGNGWSEGVHPDDLAGCHETYRSAFSARQPFKREYRLQRADGEYRWLLDSGVPLYNGSEFTGYIGSCVDLTERKLVEEQLRISERRLAEAQRLAQVGSWERYFEAEEIYWSDEMFRIFGRPIGHPADFSTFLNYVHWEDREKIRKADHQALSSGEPVIVDYRIIRLDGELRHLRSVMEVISDVVGRTRIAGATQDVTGHIGALYQLRQSEERLRNAQRLSHVGNWEWDIKTDRVIWSEETYRIFGEPPDFAPAFETFLRAVRPQDRQRVEQGLNETLAGVKPYAVEFQIVRPNGDVRMLACVAEVLRDEAGLPVRVFGACQDITEQKQAEEERAHLAKLIEKEHERLNAIISSIPGLVWESRGLPGQPEKETLFISDRVESMLGWPANDWMMKRGFCLSIVHPEDRERFAREAASIFQSQKGTGSHEFRFLTKDGKSVWVESHIAVVCDEKGNRVGMRGVTMDISERKAAETALIRTREQLVRVTRVMSMGEVAASIAHEINQPLAAIVTNGEACLRWLSKPPNTDKARDIVSSIISDANRAAEVIRGIRALLTNGESRREPMDFNQVTQETITLLREHAQSHDVQIKVTLGSQLPRVFGDRIQLQQVLLNLLLNGIDASQRAPADLPRELIVTTVIDASGDVLLEIRDSGPGIRPGDFKKIFRPFFTTKEGNLGMGLSISRTIVESHGGRIWVTANEPRGARFWVHLPTECSPL
jgi:PAS domain S-box-containing protein